MNSDLDVVKQTALSTKFANVNDELSAGVTSAPSMIKLNIRTMEFDMHTGGTIIYSAKKITGILVAASPNTSNRYYKSNFDPKAESKAPDCHSVDGVKPDSTIACPQAKFCKMCPHKVFGTKGKGKACSDYKRLIFCFFDESEGTNELSYQLYRFDVPPGSLKALPAYKNYLNTIGKAFYRVKTEIAFNPDGDYTSVCFKAVDQLNDEISNFVEKVVRKDPKISEMLSDEVREFEEESIEAPIEEDVFTPVKEKETAKKTHAKKPTAVFAIDSEDLNDEIERLTRD